eukprot:CAMPEP_0114657054 /NCGR_PEP_ID=MMETSP0191-20121206/13281_1 /TAXON_ID=126664 /ORGANISM="Sorites sp." /LENGTH=212 /DNA_ID=CAMNT_0001875527 /DNA_START=65 /DNA_END=703 /DNA_ORIENTATION=+
MPDYYVGITGSNGYTYSVPSDNDIVTHLKEYHDSGDTIKAVAIGRNDRYAVVTDEGSFACRGPDTFLNKMTELDNDDKTHKIKHITFGPDDVWAITMDNGWCHARCYHYSDEGPLDAINEHNGDIKYVSMSHKDGQWIVGFGNNGYKSRGLNNVYSSLAGFLDGVNNTKKRIDLVEIGNDSYCVKHEEGSSFATSDCNYWLKNNIVTTFSLY